jgi:YgiT-type zinc finger domain-containing protein
MHQCSLCKGKLEKGNINHVVNIDNLIIIIKKVPAEVCKQCGEYYLDHEVAKKVEDIVDNVKNNKAEVIINYYDRVA